jgi:hypothetical protein
MVVPRYRAILWRAARETVRIVIAHSWKDLLWKGVVGTVALAALVTFVWITPADDDAFLTDKIAFAVVAAATVAALIVLVFLAQLLFVAPFQLWRMEWGRADAAERRCEDLTGAGPVRDRTPLINACLFLLFGEWGRDVGELTDDKQVAALVDCLQELRQAAYENALTIWGKPERHAAIYLRIGADVWRMHRVEWFSFIEGEAHSEGGFPPWYDLQVSKSEVEGLRR